MSMVPRALSALPEGREASEEAADSSVHVIKSKKFGSEIVYRINKCRSLNIFSFRNPFRQFCINYVVVFAPFDYFVLLTILVNCVMLAMNNPPEEAEFVFTAIFTLEMVCKMVGLGLYHHEHAYLRDSWNWLDFIVVLLGYLTLVPSVGNYSAIRTFRVFRALRAFTAIPGLKMVVNALLRSMRALLDVGVVVVFFLIFLTIMSQQLFQGLLRQKCVANPSGNLSDAGFSAFINDPDNFFINEEDDDIRLCGNVSLSRSCPANHTCLLEAGGNPNFGFTSFDNFAWATLTVFQLITLEFWEDIYRKVLATVGKQAVLFFITVIFLGCFFIINLVVAVVTIKYIDAKEENEEEEELAALKLHREKSMAATAVGAFQIDHGIGDLGPVEVQTRFQRRLARLHAQFRPLVEHPWFEFVIIGVIVLNTLTLAIEYPSAPQKMKFVLGILNYIWSAVFIIEMVLKNLAYGLIGYWTHSNWNKFDGVVVILSVIEIVVVLTVGTAVGGLSVLRAFRLLRVLKLAKRWNTMRALIEVMGKIIGVLAELVLILGIVIYIFAVIGMQLFGDKFKAEKFDGELPLWNFSDFKHSALVVFRILCGEWIEVLWDTMLVAGEGAALYFILVLVLGNFVVLNLFLAVLLGAFDTETLSADKKAEEPAVPDSDSPLVSSYFLRFTKAVNRFRAWPRNKVGPNSARLPTVAAAPSATATIQVAEAADGAGERGPSAPRTRAGSDASQPRMVQVEEEKLVSNTSTACSESRLEHTGDAIVMIEKKTMTRTWTETTRKRLSLTKDEPSPGDANAATTPAGPGPDLGEMQQASAAGDADAEPHPWWRERALALVTHPVFEGTILFLILWSSIMLCFEDASLEDKPQLEEVLFYMDVFFCFAFGMELVLKLTAYGVGGYFSSSWNWLDFIIVVVAIAGLVAADSGITFLRSLRTLRALRPLRAVSRWPAMKIVVNALLGSIPSIANVFLVCALIWIIFGIMGVQFFGDTFFKCIDADGEIFDISVVNDRADCEALSGSGARFVNSNVNFDHLGNALLALFQIATFEGWIELMEDAVNARGIDLQPSRESQFAAYAFFVVFILVGGFFSLNLFIGVIIDNFNRLKLEQDSGSGSAAFLTESQKRYLEAIRTMMRARPQKEVPPPRNSWISLECYKWSQPTAWLEPFIMIVIVVNTIVFAMEHFDQSAEFTLALMIINTIFAAIYIMECAIKLIGLRGYYFDDNWNRFDFAVVIVTIAGIILDALSASLPVNPTFLRIVRLLRLIRIIRVIKRAKTIHSLLLTMVFSGPALMNIGTLLLLLTFIYSVVGMNLFAFLRHNGAINEFFNFETFPNAWLFLVQLTTGAGWNDVLDACVIQPPDCDRNFKGLPNGDCGEPIAARLYFSSYILISFLIVINMYIAVIMEALGQANSDVSENDFSEHKFNMFYERWQLFDPDATQFINSVHLREFIAGVAPPLGIRDEKVLSALDIPLYADGRAHCLDVLHTLVKRVMITNDLTVESHELQRLEKQAEKRFTNAFPVRKTMGPPPTTTTEYLERSMAAVTVQRYFRRFKARREEHKDIALVPISGHGCYTGV